MSNIEIKLFDKMYLDPMTKLFMDIYNDPEHPWTYKSSKQALLDDITSDPEFCFAALNHEGTCIGAIFCTTEPYYDGTRIFINSLQIDPAYRGQRVGTRLLNAALKKAKDKDIAYIGLLADNNKNFPKGWYEKLGFKQTGWMEFEAKI